MIVINDGEIEYIYDAKEVTAVHQVNLAPLINGKGVREIGVICVGDDVHTTSSDAKIQVQN